MGKDRIKMRTYEHVASLAIHKTPSSFTRRLSRSLKTILQWWIINYLEIKYFFPMSSIDTSSLFLKNPWYRMLMKLINGYQPLAFTLTITATKITSENTMNKSSSGESKHKFTVSLFWASWAGLDANGGCFSLQNTAWGVSFSWLFSISWVISPGLILLLFYKPTWMKSGR